ncbi:GntR family transcriptional regulator [Jannaschia sp. W003]|uniref:GntR family transcriptional regulator n=1 Tax=Jannaschia sp. W003 TaxID=2867012 RepID=UPI0021A47AFE|nr:GntR family transcriptional regulator [Jannaschia sp. W003]UWQ23197.1 GntR family transcriptional regulator [Jannaschia sp. W003]
MLHATNIGDRRTSVDVIAEHLYEEIASLRLLPGTRISEAEIAERFGVSRQPVRDAFGRLASMDLLQIRPQKATEVKRFSMAAIERARFVRAAVESEVLRRAAARCDEAGNLRLQAELAQQHAVLRANDHGAFGDLDYAFHRALCEIAGVPFAFDVIREEKAKVDRLCMLGLSKEDRMPQLVRDHEAMAAAVAAGDAEAAVAAGMEHLARLDATIEAIQERNGNYFDDVD